MTVIESWMRLTAEVVNRAGNRLVFGRECRPDFLARQSLLELCDATVKKMDDINIDKAVDVFERKWNEKVCTYRSAYVSG